VNPGETISLAVQFADVAMSDDGVSVKKLLAVTSPVGSTSASASADQIWQYNPTDGWKKYYFYKRGSITKWCEVGSTTEIDDSVKFNVGTAFFFVRASGTTSSTTDITLSGNVKSLAATPSYAVGVGETVMICNSWPMGLKVRDFNTFNTAGGVGSTSASASADQIWRYNPTTGWKKYYFYKRGSTTKWCVAGTTNEIGEDEVIAAGEGFFFVRASGSASVATEIKFRAN
jgi:hypothetical protein